MATTTMLDEPGFAHIHPPRTARLCDNPDIIVKFLAVNHCKDKPPLTGTSLSY